MSTSLRDLLKPRKISATKKAEFDLKKILLEAEKFFVSEEIECPEVVLVNKDNEQIQVMRHVSQAMVSTLQDCLRDYLAKPKKSLIQKHNGDYKAAEREAISMFFSVGWEKGFVNIALRDINYSCHLWLTLPGQTPGVSGRVNKPIEIFPAIFELGSGYRATMAFGGRVAARRAARYAKKAVAYNYEKYLNKLEKPCCHIVVYVPNLENLNIFEKQLQAVCKLADKKGWRILIDFVNDHQRPSTIEVQNVIKQNNFNFVDFHKMKNACSSFPEDYWGFMIREPDNK